MTRTWDSFSPAKIAITTVQSQFVDDVEAWLEVRLNTRWR